MPNRIIKDTICESKGMSEVSFFAADLYKRLITYADDYGRFNADLEIIRARLYPREISLVSEEDIEDAMTELAGVGKIAFYTSTARDELYGCFPKWNEHQRVRDSKQKIPEPSDVTINDWYLKRFVPMSLKEEIIERDKFKCQECGKLICPGVDSAKRLIKMGTGLFDIDHIVPVVQGGRATAENLRLLCPNCNRSRKKRFTFEEILAFTDGVVPDCENSQKVAASCGELRPNPIQSNPIQSESESKRRFTPPSFDEVKAYCEERGNKVDPQAFIDFYTSKGWKIGKETMKDWQAAVRTWERRETTAPQKKPKQFVTADQYTPPNNKIDSSALERIKRDFGL